MNSEPKAALMEAMDSRFLSVEMMKASLCQVWGSVGRDMEGQCIVQVNMLCGVKRCPL